MILLRTVGRLEGPAGRTQSSGAITSTASVSAPRNGMEVLVDQARRDGLVDEGLVEAIGPRAERRLDLVERTRRDDPVARHRHGGRGRIVALPW